MAVTRTRSASELHRRQDELETIFDTAPPDHRRLIDQLATGQLTLDDTAKALDQALAGQDERRLWILQHWPHIVEHAQITHALATTPGPELGPLLDQLAALHPPGTDPTRPHAHLADAARTNQTWLRTLASHLVLPDTDQIDGPTIELLGTIAAYRHRWQITGPSPLGHPATTDAQACERTDLVNALNSRIDQHILEIEPEAPSQPKLEEGLSL